jgi:Tfp pilus assembly protein PilF
LVLEALARGYLKSEQLKDALEACELWIARQPDHPWPWLWRGNIYERIGNADGALADYRRAVANGPEDCDARLALGNALIVHRLPSEAAEHFEHVLARRPGDAAALLGLASCRIDQNRIDDAEHLLARVDPTSPRVHLLHGRAAYQRGDYERAERSLRQTVATAPDDANALYLLVQCLQAHQRTDEAAQLAEKLETLRADLRRLHGSIRAAARRPDDIQPRLEGGLIALKVGRNAEGLRLLVSTLSLEGDHRPVHAALARYYEGQGDVTRAAEHRLMAEGR